MLPWNYGFHLDAGHIIFLGAFYTVLGIVLATVSKAAFRSFRDLRARKDQQIRWASDFHDLPKGDRTCRHQLTGEFQKRECPNSFECRRCETHARLMSHHPVASGEGEEIFGMSFPTDRMYHRGHAWVHPEDDGTVTVGLDELGSRLLGTPDGADIPPAGSHVEVNGTAFRIRKQGANVRVLSPVDGEVVETGSAERGWYLRVRPDSQDEQAFRHLLRGAEVKPWVMRELERLQLALRAEGASPSLADGGVPVTDMSRAYPQTDWDAVCGSLFLDA